jgi:hypothetical protein
MRVLTGLLLALSCSAFTQTAPIAVSVSYAPQEQMARRLASAVLKEFKRDPRFALVEHSGPAIDVALPARVGCERRLDWVEIHYQARLSSLAGRSRIVAGQCWNWNLSMCAKQIADAVAQTGRD